MKLQKLRKKSKLLTIGMIVVSVILLFLLLYYMGNGFSFNDLLFNTHDDMCVIIDSPIHGEVFYDGDDIRVTGSIWGEIPKKAIVWDERFNVPIECSVRAGRFGVTLFATDLSNGHHILCVQAQSVDGKWTAVETVRIEKRGSGTGNWVTGGGNTWVESNLPQPLAIIFRPVEEVLRSVVVYVSGGTADDDLNGDNIPDEGQQSPVPPRYNPMNVPLSAIIVFGLIILVILVLILFVVRPYNERKHKMEMELRRSPGQREWLLGIKALKNKELRAKLRTEKAKRKKLEDKYKREERKKLEAIGKRPVKIYFSEKNKKKDVAVKTKHEGLGARLKKKLKPNNR